MSNVEVRSVVTITNDHTKKHPWTPEVRTIEGIPFIHITRLSRELTRFVSGKCLDLRKGKGHSLNGSFIEKLLYRRNEAATAAVEMATEEESKDFKDEKMDKKGKKTRRVTRQDAVLAEPMLEIEVHDGLKAKVLFDVGNGPLWIELSAEVLEAVRSGILKSDEGSRRRLKRSRHA